jgi:hypothetical protein
MNELDALDLARLAAEALGEARCRRYLFDRPYRQDPPAAADGAPLVPATAPAPAGRSDRPERRG